MSTACVRKHRHQFLGMRRTNHRLSFFQASATVPQVLRIEGYDQERFPGIRLVAPPLVTLSVTAEGEFQGLARLLATMASIRDQLRYEFLVSRTIHIDFSIGA